MRMRIDPRRGLTRRTPVSAAAARALALGAFSLLAGCSWLPTWLGGTPARTQVPTPLVEIKPSLNTRIVWRASVGGSRNEMLQPAVVENAVYAAAADGAVVRLAPDTGQVVWRSDVKSRISAGVGTDGFTVSVASARGEIIALGADGKELWRTLVGGEMRSPPLVGRGLVVVRSTDYRITALDAATGKRRWTYQRANVPLTLRSLTEMVYAGDLVLAGFPGGRLVALNSANGAVRWDVAVSEPRGSTEVERLADVVGAPLVIGNEACAASYQGRIACFDAGNGNLRWSSEISAGSGPGADDRRMYMADAKSNVVAFNRAAGSTAWKQEKLLYRELSTPLALRRAIVTGDYVGVVHFLSPEDGSFVARVPLSAQIVATPRALGGGAVVQTRDGTVALVIIE
ncbi:MAG: outer membrane protein assembly factor BamB [Burkholderiaceae bacterium]|nr:outer membrane protein assembly factor BamB [Burkholderiaceae bacterium]